MPPFTLSLSLPVSVSPLCHSLCFDEESYCNSVSFRLTSTLPSDSFSQQSVYQRFSLRIACALRLPVLSAVMSIALMSAAATSGGTSFNPPKFSVDDLNAQILASVAPGQEASGKEVVAILNALKAKENALTQEIKAREDFQYAHNFLSFFRCHCRCRCRRKSQSDASAVAACHHIQLTVWFVAVDSAKLTHSSTHPHVLDAMRGVVIEVEKLCSKLSSIIPGTAPVFAPVNAVTVRVWRARACVVRCRLHRTHCVRFSAAIDSLWRVL
jgi:hypothetical protein